MNITFIKRRKDADSIPLQNDTFMDGRIGFWGNVTGVDSEKNKVRVLDSTGVEYIGLPVMSSEWVNVKDGFVSGARNLPPVGSRVFVLMPTHTITGAFVLCSGYANGDSQTQTLWEKNKEKISESITPGGWIETEDYESGNKTIKDKDNNVSITVNEGKKEITLSAFKYSIKIDKNGLVIDSNENPEIKIKSDSDIKIDAAGKDLSIIAKNFSVSDSASGEKLLEVNR